MFLFSIGIDDTKALSLLHGLYEFKERYDRNELVKDILPDLGRIASFYNNMRIQELAQGIHNLIRKHNLPELMFRAFDVLPEMVMKPQQAFRAELRGETEECFIEDLVGKLMLI